MLLGVEEKKQKLTKDIIKYKDLVDEKIITQEEFSIKEKELLFTINNLSQQDSL